MASGLNFLYNLLYKDVTAKVIVNGFLTDSFSIERGVRQGCSLSTLLYVLCVESLANAIRKDSSSPPTRGRWS